MRPVSRRMDKLALWIQNGGRLNVPLTRAEQLLHLAPITVAAATRPRQRVEQRCRGAARWRRGPAHRADVFIRGIDSPLSCTLMLERTSLLSSASAAQDR